MADTRNETERHIEEIVELSNEEMEHVQGGSVGFRSLGGAVESIIIVHNHLSDSVSVVDL